MKIIKDLFDKYSLSISATIFLIFSTLIILITNKVFGVDSLYHIKHAFLYKQNGLLDTSFPYVSASTIAEYGADIWYGFHIILIPFTFIDDPLLSVKIATIFLATLSLTSFFWLIKSINIKYPFFWTVVLLFSSADFLFRIFMVRPHIVSLLLSFALLIYFIKNKPYSIFFTSVLVSFIHIALAWVPILIIIISTLASFITEKKIYIKNILASFLGLLGGVLLHPNIIGTLKLSYIQIVELFITKGQDIPMQFGRELNLLNFGDIILQYIPLFAYLIFILFIIFSIYINKAWTDISPPNKKTLIANLLLSFIFLILAFISARRSTDFLSVFSILLSASLLTSLFEIQNFRPIIKAQSFYIISGIFLVFMILNGSLIFNQFIKNTVDPHKFEATSSWLKANTSQGDIVFNAYWDNFPNLFFWNSHNYYISGMDPIFQYSFSQDLYWKAYFIAYNGQPITCGEMKCTEDKVEDIGLVLKRDFKAKYIIVEHRRSSNLYKNLEEGNLTGFKKVFTGETESIYQII